MIIKLFAAALPICLAIGCALGYRISESEREHLTSKFNREASTMPKPKPVPITRPELEQRLIACIGKPLRLQSFTDKDLNDSLFECEALKAKS